jgi:hypothetical protein
MVQTLGRIRTTNGTTRPPQIRTTGVAQARHEAVECSHVIDSDGVRLAGAEIGGDLTGGFVRLPHGTDLGPALAGLPGDLCHCPHWGYLLSGRIDLRTAEGAELY